MPYRSSITYYESIPESIRITLVTPDMPTERGGRRHQTGSIGGRTLDPEISSGEVILECPCTVCPIQLPLSTTTMCVTVASHAVLKRNYLLTLWLGWP